MFKYIEKINNDNNLNLNEVSGQVILLYYWVFSTWSTVNSTDEQ
jgi:hypothetical protein